MHTSRLLGFDKSIFRTRNDGNGHPQPAVIVPQGARCRDDSSSDNAGCLGMCFERRTRRGQEGKRYIWKMHSEY
jgi:hypothetical protein